MRFLFAGLWLWMLTTRPVCAASPVEEAQQAELDRARSEIANEVQLAAYDLIDELIYGWTQDPVFENPRPIVLAGVTVPVGLGVGMQALIENHIASVLNKNPTTNLQLVHCPSCTAVVVHSGPEATVVSRGIDNPAVLEELGAASGKHALFIDVEAEGAWLVLRARITQLTPDLPIVWSHTVATSSSTPALLREPHALKSAAEAREDYLNTLNGNSPFTIPVRLAMRAYAGPPWWDDQAGTGPPPFLWVQTGVEIAATDAKAWTSSIMVGGAFIPQAYQGLMGQARVSRLLTGRSRSLTRPDLYGFLGAAVLSVWGPSTASFRNEILTTDQIVAGLEGDDPRNLFGAFQLGAEVRVGNRIGASLFMETLPAFQNSRTMGPYVLVLGLNVQSFGTEVTFCF